MADVHAEFTVTKAAWEYQYERAERAEAALELEREQGDKDALARWGLHRRAMKAEAALADLRAGIEALVARHWRLDDDGYQVVDLPKIRALIEEA